MGPCNLWNVKETASPQPFPRCPWALDLSQRPFPGRHKGKPAPDELGGWYWESGFDLNPIAQAEAIRDWNFRAMYGAWDALKNTDGVLPNHALNWSAYVSGSRESRRLLGDVVLTKQDLVSGQAYPDGCAPTGWNMDLHLPDPRYEKGFEGNAFISEAHFGKYPMPYWIPYRCLYSRNIENLFMAGRDISVTHEALGAVRVMRTGGCMGEVVGMAASLAASHRSSPRAVYELYLDELKALMRRGVGKSPAATALYENQGEPAGKPKRSPQAMPPPWLARAGVNLARTASITVSSAPENASLLNDGKADLTDNSQRWLSKAGVPQTIELTWDKPQAFNAARIVSGFCDSTGALTGALDSWKFLVHDGTDWREVPGARAAGNTRADWCATFAAQHATRVRLQITATPNNIARIWEIGLYNVP